MLSKDNQIKGSYIIWIFYSLAAFILGIYSTYIIHYILVTYTDTNIKVYLKAFDVPINILIDTMIVLTAIYGGGENYTTFIKGRNLPEGVGQTMTPKQKKRLFSIFKVWSALTFIMTALNMWLGDNLPNLNFYLNELYFGLMFATSSIAVANKMPKITEDMTDNKIDDPVPADEPTTMDIPIVEKKRKK